MCVLGPGGSVDYRQGVVPEQELERIADHDKSIDDCIMSSTKLAEGSMALEMYRLQ